MAGEKINLEYITEYLHEVLPESEGYIAEMEKFALTNDVPIIHKEVKFFLEMLCHMIKPSRVLEIGTAIGYSSSVLAMTSETTKVTTIEREPAMTELALKNHSILGLSDRIRIIEGDALEVLDCLKEKYDLIFIDAAKGYYSDFFSYAKNLINPGGVIVCDNILYKGMTATDELLKRRQKTIVYRMRDFLHSICRDENLKTSIIPMGDGLAVSYYIKEEISDK